MLSIIFRLSNEFENSQGHRPNVIYLSEDQYAQLKREVALANKMEPLVRFLGMCIVISNDTDCPRVASIEKMCNHRAAP